VGFKSPTSDRYSNKIKCVAIDSLSQPVKILELSVSLSSEDVLL
jgi:hypothetical protein